MNLNTTKLEELLATLKKKEEEKDKNTVLWVLAIIGAVAAVAGIAFAVYRFFAPDYLEDFEEDFDDDFDDYFEDDDETETFKIVSTMRGDSISGRISSDSPMGAALMGHKVGDRVEVKVNEKVSYYVVIKSIENTGEEETDTIRTF